MSSVGRSGSESSRRRKRWRGVSSAAASRATEEPTDQVPQVACVMMDGGRIQVRDRHEQASWKESLVGCCLSMVSEDRPTTPVRRFPRRLSIVSHELSREIKGFSASDETTQALVKIRRRSRRKPRDRGQKRRRRPSDASAADRRSAHVAAFRPHGAKRSWPTDRRPTGAYTRNTSRTTPRFSISRTRSAMCTPRRWPGEAAERMGRLRRWAQWLWEGATDKLIARCKRDRTNSGRRPTATNFRPLRSWPTRWAISKTNARA